MNTKKPRIAIIGARRVRQGLGPYIAAGLADRGMEIAAVLGTSPLSAEQAMADLHVHHGLRPRPYHEFDRMIEDQQLDALVIACPAEHHLEYLHAAYRHDLHVLCEKPFVWGCENPTAVTEQIVTDFRKKNLMLMSNVQWPFTLPTFKQLHPQAYGIDRVVTEFEMLLCPSKEGEAMVLDSFSHVYSMLGALQPSPRPTVYDFHFEFHSTNRSHLTVDFEYIDGPETVHCKVTLKRVGQPPRPAGYTVNGYRVDRVVAMPDYSMTFTDGKRSVQLADPLKLLLADFDLRLQDAMQGQTAYIDPNIVHRTDMMEAAMQAYQQACGRS